MGGSPEHRGSDEHFEIELKLHVPPPAFAAVEAAVRDAPAIDEVHLRAEYHDTDDWSLAAEGLTWRIRREGQRWVQTLKGRVAGSDGMTRVEHDVDVTERAIGAGAPLLDASLHDGPAGHRLGQVLARLHARGTAVHVRFATDVERIERAARNEHGTVLLALDRGHITAGSLRVPVSELEIELVDGTPEAVTAEAERWATQFGLERDPVNKARRGRALADRWQAEGAGGGTARSTDRTAGGNTDGDVGAPEPGR